MAQADAEAPKPSGNDASGATASSAENAHSAGTNGHGSSGGHGSFWALMLGSIGVVYGDIGTSPLYAFKESLHHVAMDGTAATRTEVIGIISLIFWALMLVVTLKYVVLVLQMDNKGEGGTLSLMALAQRALGRRTPWLFMIGIVGASLFYGDAIITPAISVMSAVEGIREVKAIAPYVTQEIVLAIAIGILIGIFLVQSRGTGRIGRWFGPITAVWFLVMGGLGLWRLLTDDWSIIEALSPHHAIGFIFDHKFLSFIVLGSVFLAVTGAEALYADMGHFGRKPIRSAWMALVLPCLTLNYLGQGALVLSDPSAAASPFFQLAPDGPARIALIALAAVATVIASQAVISGAFSLTQQAIQLGLLPRMEIRRTSETQFGQVYMPQVNWMLLVGVLFLTVTFQSSTALAAAYGISITGEMMMSTLMVFIVIWRLWKQPLWVAMLIVAPFFVIEAVFLSSNLLKLFQGGFVPLLLALALVTVIWTWVRGTRLLQEQTRREEPLDKLFEMLALHPPIRVRGTAIFLTADPNVAPTALMHNLKHNQVLHEQIIILTVNTAQQPRVAEADRVKVEDYLPEVKIVRLNFGFMETPNVVKALTAPKTRKLGLKFDIMKTSFFLSRRTVVPSEKSGMPLWQDHLFIYLARNATNATDFFHIPSGRAVELGNQVMV
ncbi:MAG: potassium transporter Kup [Caulobacterales bacterium]